MAFRRLLAVCTVCVAGTSLADPVVVEAREFFRLRLVDGGVSPFTNLVPLPGQDLALVGATDVGLPTTATEYALIQLGGPGAGAVVGSVQSSIAGAFFPEQLLRASGGGSTSTYWAFHSASLAGALGRIDSGAMTVLPVVDRSFAGGTTLSADTHGLLRAIGVDLHGNVISVAFVARDGGVGTVPQTGIRLQPGAAAPGSAFSPPGTSDVFAFSGTTPLTASYGTFTRPDGGLDPLGPVPISPVAFSSAVYTYLVGFTASTGVFEVTQLSATAATSRGTFSVVLDGGCASPVCSSQSLTLHALREGFPGYPDGALVLTGYGPPTGPQLVVLVPWENLATAFGLLTDATADPDAALGNSVDDGPGGGTGPTQPHGPGIGGSATGGCSAAHSTAAAPAALALLALVVRRVRRPGR